MLVLLLLVVEALAAGCTSNAVYVCLSGRGRLLSSLPSLDCGSAPVIGYEVNIGIDLS